MDKVSEGGRSNKPSKLVSKLNELIDFSNNILDFIYPIGSYFITESSDFDTVEKVQTHFGGRWEQLEENRTLWSVTNQGIWNVAENNTKYAGQKIKPGIPNIVGAVSGIKGTSSGYLYMDNGVGALSTVAVANSSNRVQGNENSNSYAGKKSAIQFNARTGVINTPDRVSAGVGYRVDGEDEMIYGDSTTVQPPAIAVYMYIRRE